MEAYPDAPPPQEPDSNSHLRRLTDDENTQPPAEDYGDWRREKFGNNKYHQPKYVAKAKRKAAKASQRRNRSKK